MKSKYEYFLNMQSKQSLIDLIIVQRKEIECLKNELNTQQGTYEALQDVYSSQLCLNLYCE